MALYEYRCDDCGSVSEILTGVSWEDPEIKCEGCDSESVVKLMSASSFTIAGSSRVQEQAHCGAEFGETCGRCEHAE